MKSKALLRLLALGLALASLWLWLHPQRGAKVCLFLVPPKVPQVALEGEQDWKNPSRLAQALLKRSNQAYLGDFKLAFRHPSEQLLQVEVLQLRSAPALEHLQRLLEQLNQELKALDSLQETNSQVDHDVIQAKDDLKSLEKRIQENFSLLEVNFNRYQEAIATYYQALLRQKQWRETQADLEPQWVALAGPQDWTRTRSLSASCLLGLALLGWMLSARGKAR